jgi:hypothetical protein
MCRRARKWFVMGIASALLVVGAAPAASAASTLTHCNPLVCHG